VGLHGHGGGGHQGEHHGPHPVGVLHPSVGNCDLRMLLRVMAMMGKLGMRVKTGKMRGRCGETRGTKSQLEMAGE
jgi:hypothetical protein